MNKYPKAIRFTVRLIHHRQVGLLCALAMLLAALPFAVEAVGPSVFLLPEHLAEVGLHLPEYMPTLLDVMHYQDSMTVHQEFDIEWDSLPGRTEMQRKPDLEGIPLAPNFTVLARRRGLKGGPGKSSDVVTDSTLIIVAITAHKEIHGLVLRGDPRELFSEDLTPGKQRRTDFVRPKATIYFVLPDDPQIETLLFFKAAKGGSDGGWRLQEVGRLPLGAR